MPERDHIRNPIEWSMDQLKTADLTVVRASHSLRHHEAAAPLPAVRRIAVADLRDALARGVADFANGIRRFSVKNAWGRLPDDPAWPPGVTHEIRASISGA